MAGLAWTRITEPLTSLRDLATSRSDSPSASETAFAEDLAKWLLGLAIAMEGTEADSPPTQAEAAAAVLAISDERISELVEKRQQLRSEFIDEVRRTDDQTTLDDVVDAHRRVHELGILYGRELVEWARAAETASVFLAKTQGRMSWAQIGRQLDTTAQSAHQRFTSSR